MNPANSSIRVLCVWRKSGHRFKKNDYDILNKAFDTSLFYFKLNPFSILKLFFMLRKYDVGYAWFGNLWAFFMVLFGKVWGVKTAIVAGGHDVANVPQIRYGLPQTKFLKYFAKYALKHADLVLSVSKFNQNELLKFVTPKNNALVYNCVNNDGFSAEEIYKKDQVVTAGQIDKKSSLRKGHFEFLEVARCMPDIEFIHVGGHKDDTFDTLKENSPQNVKYTGYLSDQEYGEILNESKVYLQLSKHEAFGVSVVEAMLHGCTPVVSCNGALPEVVGETGVIVKTEEPEAIADKIRWIFKQHEYNLEARKRAEVFTLDHRSRELIPLIEAIVRKEG